MDVPIRQPAPYSRSQNLMEVKAPIPNGSNDWLAGTFVKRDGSLVTACVTGDVVCVGWMGGQAPGVGEIRPETYWRNTPGMYPLNPDGTEFLINVTDNSGNVTAASSGPQASAVTVGNSYGIFRWTSGDLEGMQALNKDETSNTLFQVTALGPNTAAADYNGLVRVRIIPSKVQP